MPKRVARDVEYLMARSIPEPNSGCWLWLGRLDERGYVQINLSPFIRAHHLACFLKHGKRPEGKEVDHICRVTSCVNPDHMRYLTPAENKARRIGVWSRRFCAKGHPFSGDNVAIGVRTDHPDRVRRYCRTCQREKDRVKRLKQRNMK